ncbi:ankyrin repeat and SOCS box protein 5-like [Lingula anatina]|uniref:Ankyrin repeat and SOCS box protein 5-like n=1 Tax=Lingula anatina TaxID=7574 RepID=A0A1S3J6R8_LINAN|nr:ankyrin repeat and SOCS box protein 5-like [Lingula anatina]XP_013406003.1 ankyrin repeat and SOCS box protein 5-like [Lingula anatina]|eukprot:XP_013406002.1 ankyrin repeat and SOCS box protein 5-like [Lingula anatina]
MSFVEEYFRFIHTLNHRLDNLTLKLGSSNGKQRILYKAIWKSDYRQVQKILTAGYSKIENDMKALEKAAAKGDLGIVQLLLDYGCIPKDRKSKALDLAVLKGHTDIALLLIEWGVEYRGRNQYNETLLYVAACGNHVAMIEKLVQLGCDMNETTRTWTPLHVTTQRNHTESLLCLLRHGADPNVTNVDHHTPLDMAVCQESFENVRYLLFAGAKVNIQHIYSLPGVQQVFQRNPEILMLLNENSRQPPPLIELCRIAIRQGLGQQVMFVFRSLPLPKILQQYIAMLDILVKPKARSRATSC